MTRTTRWTIYLDANSPAAEFRETRKQWCQQLRHQNHTHFLHESDDLVVIIHNIQSLELIARVIPLSAIEKVNIKCLREGSEIVKDGVGCVAIKGFSLSLAAPTMESAAVFDEIKDKKLSRL